MALIVRWSTQPSSAVRSRSQLPTKYDAEQAPHGCHPLAMTEISQVRAQGVLYHKLPSRTSAQALISSEKYRIEEGPQDYYF